MAREKTRDVRLRVKTHLYANAEKLAAFKKQSLKEWINEKLEEIIEREMKTLPECQRIHNYVPSLNIRDPSFFNAQGNST